MSDKDSVCCGEEHPALLPNIVDDRGDHTFLELPWSEEQQISQRAKGIQTFVQGNYHHYD